MIHTGGAVRWRIYAQMGSSYFAILCGECARDTGSGGRVPERGERSDRVERACRPSPGSVCHRHNLDFDCHYSGKPDTSAFSFGGHLVQKAKAADAHLGVVRGSGSTDGADDVRDFAEPGSWD